jgi:FtsH-binding integral membrane protein
MMEKAKKTITAALIGLVIALSANTFLVEIWDILEPTEGTPPAGPKFKDIAVNVLQFLLSIVGILAIIGMVVGGMMMMTAYGNQEKITKGKNILTYSIIGIVISLSALIIVRQVSELVLGTG